MQTTENLEELHYLMHACIGCGQLHTADTPCVDGTLWWTGVVHCDNCHYQYISSVPTKDLDFAPQNLKCPACNEHAVNAL